MIMGLKANLNLGESHSVAVVTDDGQEHHYQVKVSDK
jgi:copper(I)-binding protein